MKNTAQKINHKKTIIIIGARMDGHAGVVVDTLKEIGGYELVGFLDNTPSLQNKTISGVPVLGSSDELTTMKFPADCAHIAIG
nr:hypothetical protein [Candidatus Omnitrophota bacterium]